MHFQCAVIKPDAHNGGKKNRPKNYKKLFPMVHVDFTMSAKKNSGNNFSGIFRQISAYEFCIQILRIISHISSSYLCLLLSLVCFKFCSRCSLLLVCFCCLPLHSSSDICSTVSWRHNCPITAEPKVQCQIANVQLTIPC